MIPKMGFIPTNADMSNSFDNNMWTGFLDADEIEQVEARLLQMQEDGGTVYVFVPSEFSQEDGWHTPSEWWAWLENEYPSVTFKTTTTMMSGGIHSKALKYLLALWYNRQHSRISLIMELEALRKEIGPLRKLQSAVSNLQDALSDISSLTKQNLGS